VSAMTYEAILFDLDGVLVDSLGVIERILREWAAEDGWTPTARSSCRTAAATSA
jgi:beta-phosphoglucomutase-like phosphatase (HAD superfamily)